MPTAKEIRLASQTEPTALASSALIGGCTAAATPASIAATKGNRTVSRIALGHAHMRTASQSDGRPKLQRPTNSWRAANSRSTSSTLL